MSMETKFRRSENVLVDLGEDILLYDGDEPSVVTSLLGRVRFLNALWLPSVLSQLTPSQIVIVNRFREFRLVRDNQFKHALTAREVVVEFIRILRPKSLLEIGCGKFPVFSDISVDRYRCIEIDREAIEYCRSNGLDAGTLSDFFSEGGASFDMIVSLYALHFNISGSLVEYLSNVLGLNSCFLFNIIVDDATSVMNTLGQLSRNFPFCRIMKTSLMAKREYFVPMSRSSISSQSIVLERLLASAGPS